MNKQASFATLRDSPISKRHNDDLYSGSQKIHPLTDIYLFYFQNVPEDEMRKNFSEASALVINSRSTKISQWFVNEPYFIEKLHPCDAALMEPLLQNCRAMAHQTFFLQPEQDDKSGQSNFKKFGSILRCVTKDELIFKYNPFKEYCRHLSDSHQANRINEITEKALNGMDRTYRGKYLQQIAKDFANTDNSGCQEMMLALLDAGVKNKYISKQEISILFSEELARLVHHTRSKTITMPIENITQIQKFQEHGYNFNFEVVQKMTPECFAEAYIERCSRGGRLDLLINLVKSDNPPIKEFKEKKLIEKIENRFNQNEHIIKNITRTLEIAETQQRKSELDVVIAKTVKHNPSTDTVRPSNSFKL